MNSKLHPLKLALIGERGTGKTSLLLDLIKSFHKKEVEVAGIISRGIFNNGVKVAIEAVDIESGEGHVLARLTTDVKTDLQYGDWSFYLQTIDWANQRLTKITQTDILIVDEIGPMELDQDGGFQAGLSLFDRSNFRIGILTARPKCVDALSNRFPGLQFYSVTFGDKNQLYEQILSLW